MTSAYANPSCSVVAPAVTAMRRENIGPATTQVWNSPFSPHGSALAGNSASSMWSKRRPAKDRGTWLRSTHTR